MSDKTNKDLSASTEYSEGSTSEGGQGKGRGGRGRGGRGRGGRGGRGSPRPPRPEVPGHRVSISHLPKDTNKDDITHLCQPYGKINDVFVRKYEAIVTFDKYSDATYAIFDLSQKKYRDDHIVVEWAKPKKQFNDKEKKEKSENGETEETEENKESGEKKEEGEATKEQATKKNAKEAEKKEEKPARPLFSEMQKVSTGSNPAKKQPAKKKATQNKKKGNQKQTETQASAPSEDVIAVAAPEPALKPVATLPPAEVSAPVEQTAPAKKGNNKNNKKQQQQEKAAQPQQTNNSQGKSGSFEVKMRDINTKEVKSTLNTVSAEDIEKFLKPLVPIFEVTVRNEATGEEKVYGLTDYQFKNNFTPFVQAYYSQLGQ